MKTENPNHTQNIHALKRIEGQVRGIQQMIESKRYCIDILTQLSAINAALKSVQDNILKRHLDTCVANSFSNHSKKEQQEKIEEIIKILKTYRKNG